MFLLLVFHKVFEPSRHFMLQMVSDVCDGFVGVG
jgi:hypothetical protein